MYFSSSPPLPPAPFYSLASTASFCCCSGAINKWEIFSSIACPSGLQMVTTAGPHAGVEKSRNKIIKEKSGNIFSGISGFSSLLSLIQIKQVCTQSLQVCLHQLLNISFQKIQFSQREGKINSWAMRLIYTSNILWIGWSSINQIAGVSLKYYKVRRCVKSIFLSKIIKSSSLWLHPCEFWYQSFHPPLTWARLTGCQE